MKKSTLKSVNVVLGATSGLGWHLASQFFKKGQVVMAFSRRLDRLQGLKAMLCEKMEDHCCPVKFGASNKTVPNRPVTLSEAKGPVEISGFFAPLRMTARCIFPINKRIFNRTVVMEDNKRLQIVGGNILDAKSLEYLFAHCMEINATIDRVFVCAGTYASVESTDNVGLWRSIMDTNFFGIG